MASAPALSLNQQNPNLETEIFEASSRIMGILKQIEGLPLDNDTGKKTAELYKLVDYWKEERARLERLHPPPQGTPSLNHFRLH